MAKPHPQQLIICWPSTKAAFWIMSNMSSLFLSGISFNFRLMPRLWRNPQDSEHLFPTVKDVLPSLVSPRCPFKTIPALSLASCKKGNVLQRRLSDSPNWIKTKDFHQRMRERNFYSSPQVSRTEITSQKDVCESTCRPEMTFHKYGIKPPRYGFHSTCNRPSWMSSYISIKTSPKE